MEEATQQPHGLQSRPDSPGHVHVPGAPSRGCLTPTGRRGLSRQLKEGTRGSLGGAGVPGTARTLLGPAQHGRRSPHGRTSLQPESQGRSASLSTTRAPHTAFPKCPPRRRPRTPPRPTEGRGSESVGGVSKIHEISDPDSDTPRAPVSGTWNRGTSTQETSSCRVQHKCHLRFPDPKAWLRGDGLIQEEIGAGNESGGGRHSTGAQQVSPPSRQGPRAHRVSAARTAWTKVNEHTAQRSWL